MSGTFDNKGTKIMIKNFNIDNDHLGGLLSSFWMSDFLLTETSVFSKCVM